MGRTVCTYGRELGSSKSLPLTQGTIHRDFRACNFLQLLSWRGSMSVLRKLWGTEFTTGLELLVWAVGRNVLIRVVLQKPLRWRKQRWTWEAGQDRRRRGEGKNHKWRKQQKTGVKFAFLGVELLVSLGIHWNPWCIYHQCSCAGGACSSALEVQILGFLHSLFSSALALATENPSRITLSPPFSLLINDCNTKAQKSVFIYHCNDCEQPSRLTHLS